MSPSIASCPPVTEFAEWIHENRRGIFAFACEQRSSGHLTTLAALDAFDQQTGPRVSTRAAFEAMSAAYRPDNLESEEYLAGVVNHRRPFVIGPTGDQEARAFVATHFRQRGIPASPTDVQVFHGGTNGVLMAMVSAMAKSPVMGDYLIVPPGYQHIAGLISGLQHEATVVVDKLGEKVLLNDWLVKWAPDRDTVIIYLPMVNRLTGEKIARRRLYGVARAVLEYNRYRPDNPAFVFADESAIDRYTSDPHDAPSIAAITGADLGDPSLGPMSSWTLTTAAPGEVFDLANPQVTFAVTHNPWLRNALTRWSPLYTTTVASPMDELIVAAQLCLTPPQWLRQTQEHAAHALHALRQELHHINKNFGFDAITASTHTTGGGHAALHLHPNLLSNHLLTSIDTLIDRLQCGNEQLAATLTLSPHDLFTWHCHPPHSLPFLTLQVNLTVSDQALAELVTALNDITTALHATTKSRSLTQEVMLAEVLARTAH